MDKLSSPRMQRIFKSIRRLNISLYAVMLLLMLSGISLCVLMSTRFGNYYGGLDWAQIAYIVILAITFVYSAAVLILNLTTRKPYKAALRAYIASVFSAQEDILKGGADVEIAIYLLGDRLCVARQGEERLIYIDLSSVRNYYSVCSDIASLIKKYLAAYYGVNADGEGYRSAVIVNSAGGKAKAIKAVEGGAPVKDLARNPFVKYGYLHLHKYNTEK